MLWLLGRRPRIDRTADQLGFTGVFLLYFTQNIGLEYTSASNGALIHGGIPVLTALLAIVILREHRKPRRLAGILASMVGFVVAGLFLGESISAIQIGGGGAILLGVWLAPRPAALPATRASIPPRGQGLEHQLRPT